MKLEFEREEKEGHMKYNRPKRRQDLYIKEDLLKGFTRLKKAILCEDEERVKQFLPANFPGTQVLIQKSRSGAMPGTGFFGSGLIYQGKIPGRTILFFSMVKFLIRLFHALRVGQNFNIKTKKSD